MAEDRTLLPMILVRASNVWGAINCRMESDDDDVDDDDEILTSGGLQGDRTDKEDRIQYEGYF